MKKLNLTVVMDAIGTVTVEVPDEMTFEEAMEWAKNHKNELPTPDYPDISKTVSYVDEDNCDFEDEDEPEQAPVTPYEYVYLNKETVGSDVLDKNGATIDSQLTYPTYLCMNGDIEQFKTDVEKLHFWTTTVTMTNGEKAVVAIDLPSSEVYIDTAELMDAILALDHEAETMDGPISELRAYNFPVYYEMYAHQVIIAHNMTEALKKLDESPLPDNAQYTDDSFNIDDEGVITVR